jgi:hypothetical protein
MAVTKSIFKRWTGTQWDTFYFKTSADLIDETTSYKVMTSAERDAIATYLTSGFNTAGLLVQINAANAAQDASKIDRSLIGDLSGSYLTVNNPTFTGTLTGPTIKGTTDGTLTLKSQYTNNSNAASIVLGNDTMTFNLAGSGQSGFFTYSGTQQQGVGKIDLGLENELTGLLTPFLASDAATKGYVDNLVAEGVKPVEPVVAATTANITLSGAQTIDGIAVTTTQRVLVKNQTTASQNGIYVVNGDGDWTKLTLESVKGTLVFITAGTTNNDSKFYASTDTSWILFSRTDTITASGGLQRVGDDVRIADLGVTNAKIAANTIVLSTKTASFTALDNANASYDTWGELTPANTSENITVKLNNLYAAIGLLRGTANYNTNNTQTIDSVNTLAAAKNRTYTGSEATPTGTFVSGDLYFQQL